MTKSDQIRTLASPVRVEILAVLKKYGALPASQIIDKLSDQVSASTLSSHLNKLRMTQLVTADSRAGKPVYAPNREVIESVAESIAKLA